MNRQCCVWGVCLGPHSEKCRLPLDTSLIPELKRTVFICQNPTALGTAKNSFHKTLETSNSNNNDNNDNNNDVNNGLLPEYPSLPKYSPAVLAQAPTTMYHRQGGLVATDIYFSWFWRLDI